ISSSTTCCVSSRLVNVGILQQI
ncbi:uncharacterized, partial [Tachysurus ichikawai]